MKLAKERFAKEIARLNSLHEREVQQREQMSKTIDERYKYKMKYLEQSQAELKREKQRIEDQEQEENKRANKLEMEVREWRSKYNQAVALHEAVAKRETSKGGTSPAKAQYSAPTLSKSYESPSATIEAKSPTVLASPTTAAPATPIAATPVAATPVAATPVAAAAPQAEAEVSSEF